MKKVERKRRLLQKAAVNVSNTKVEMQDYSSNVQKEAGGQNFIVIGWRVNSNLKTLASMHRAQEDSLVTCSIALRIVAIYGSSVKRPKCTVAMRSRKMAVKALNDVRGVNVVEERGFRGFV